MGMTMTQKILAAHAGLAEVKAGQLIEADLDLVLGNDITTPVAVNEMKKMDNQFSTSASWTVRVTPSNVPTKAPAEAPVCSACTCGYSICTFLIFTVARFVVPRESVPGVTAPIRAPALAFVRTTGWQISRFLTLISCVTVPNSPPVPSTAVIELAVVFPTCRPSIRYVFP